MNWEQYRPNYSIVNAWLSCGMRDWPYRFCSIYIVRTMQHWQMVIVAKQFQQLRFFEGNKSNTLMLVPHALQLVLCNNLLNVYSNLDFCYSLSLCLLSSVCLFVWLYVFVVVSATINLPCPFRLSSSLVLLHVTVVFSIAVYFSFVLFCRSASVASTSQLSFKYVKLYDRGRCCLFDVVLLTSRLLHSPPQRLVPAHSRVRTHTVVQLLILRSRLRPWPTTFSPWGVHPTKYILYVNSAKYKMFKNHNKILRSPTVFKN